MKQAAHQGVRGECLSAARQTALFIVLGFEGILPAPGARCQDAPPQERRSGVYESGQPAIISFPLTASGPLSLNGDHGKALREVAL